MVKMCEQNSCQLLKNLAALTGIERFNGGF
jgi:hypothetical protein